MESSCDSTKNESSSCAQLENKAFSPISPARLIETGSTSTEDARIFRYDGKLFVMYNGSFEPVPCNTTEWWNRILRFGTLKDDKLLHITPIPHNSIQLRRTEKNWVPLEYFNKEKGTKELYFIYQASPYTLIHVPNPAQPQQHEVLRPRTAALYTVWDRKLFGPICGGTPALLVDDSYYLSFFHSHFDDMGKGWYIMGAYLLEPYPPFRPIAITKSPIVFQEMYSAPLKKEKLRSLFPCGFVQDMSSGHTLLHVACGENDTNIRIVTIDKDALIQSMTPLDPQVHWITGRHIEEKNNGTLKSSSKRAIGVTCKKKNKHHQPCG